MGMSDECPCVSYLIVPFFLASLLFFLSHLYNLSLLHTFSHGDDADIVDGVDVGTQACAAPVDG